MDISYESIEINRKCFKCDEPIIQNLNVVYNTWNTAITLWNKFQIIVYENLDFDGVPKIIVPEFQIHNFITSSNYLVCVDTTGNVHTTSLKFKNAQQKRFKYSFQPRAQGIVACLLFDGDHTLSLKYESEAYFLCIHKINAEFNLKKNVIIISKEDLPVKQMREKFILKSCLINTESILEYVKRVFNIEDVNVRNNYSLVVITFDKLNVFGCLFDVKTPVEEITLVKLYTCPSDISDIDFIQSDNFNIVIGLTIGTIVTLNFKNSKPNIIHLNTAIHKFSMFEDTVLYTDGVTMWKAEKILVEDINFTQFFIKNVKDFVKFGDHLVCTTFNNLIYTFPLDDERSYVKVQTTDEYCAAEHFWDNSMYLTKIVHEVEKNKVLIERQTRERNYIMALSLANRQDVMDSIVSQKVIVYENYEDAILENADILLTNNYSEYFDTESFYFLIRITTKDHNKLIGILSQSLGDLRIHVIFTSDNKIIKTMTLKVKDLIKSIALLVPLKTKSIDTTEIRVNLKIVTNMPGALDAQHKIWAVLYRKTINLNSEHFIKFHINSNKTICLKQPTESLDRLILQAAKNQYGSLIKISENLNQKVNSTKWKMYVKLPSQYQELLTNMDSNKQLVSKKVNYFLQQFTSKEFLRSRSNITLSIGKEKLQVEIENDGFSTPALKISSLDIKIVLDIRNFLSNLIYYIFMDTGPGQEIVNHSFYIVVELVANMIPDAHIDLWFKQWLPKNIQKAVKECISNGSEEEILPLIEEFERKVVGLLPI